MAQKRSTHRQKQTIPTPIFLVLAAIAALLYIWQNGYFQNTPVAGTLQVHVIDVGQGDSILITTDAGAMLIDTGESEHAQTVINYLHDVGVTELAYAVATHPHSDHMGGMSKVIEAFPIDTFIAPDAVNTSRAFEKMLDALEARDLTITVPTLGETFVLGEATFTAIVPQNAAPDDLNNQSVVLRLDYGQTSFLFTGDAESSAEKEMLASEISLDCDVLKVGHHGSRTSSSAAFLEAVSPDIAIISCGAGNSYNHPHEEIVTRLEKTGADLRRTDLEGTIVLVSDGKTIRDNE